MIASSTSLFSDGIMSKMFEVKNVDLKISKDEKTSVIADYNNLGPSGCNGAL